MWGRAEREAWQWRASEVDNSNHQDRRLAQGPDYIHVVLVYEKFIVIRKVFIIATRGIT
jgi:hypothetical protein